MPSNGTQSKASRLATVLLPPLMFFCLLGLTFSTRPNWGVPPPPQVGPRLKVPENMPFLGSIDTPLEAQTANYLVMSGWATATTPGQRVTAVEIYINGVLAQRVTEFFPRSDVAAVYSRPDFDLSGWRCTIPTQRFKPGEYDLEMRLVTTDGKSTSFMKKTLRILE